MALAGHLARAEAETARTLGSPEFGTNQDSLLDMVRLVRRTVKILMEKVRNPEVREHLLQCLMNDQPVSVPSLSALTPERKVGFCPQNLNERLRDVRIHLRKNLRPVE
jgi:hypothetical protein